MDDDDDSEPANTDEVHLLVNQTPENQVYRTWCGLSYSSLAGYAPIATSYLEMATCERCRTNLQASIGTVVMPVKV